MAEFWGKSIDEFRATIGARKFQPPNSYKVLFTPPANSGMADMECYPESVVLPEQSILPLLDNTWGSERKIPTKSIYGEILMSFILLSDWKERQYFEDWFDWITPHSASGGMSLISQPTSPYEESIGFCQIDFLAPDKTTISKTYQTHEIYPLSVTPVSFSSDATGYATFQVIFYTRNTRNLNTLN